MSEASHPIVIERGTKRTFASSLDWPGWSRSAKGGVEPALDALREYEGRYGLVAVRAVADEWTPGLPFEVIQTVAGTATTDFGAPDAQAAAEDDPLGGDTERFVRLYEVSWQVLIETAERAPAELRKGPRGGGRDTSDVVRHTAAAEASYGRKLGVKLSKEYVAADRSSVAGALRAAAADPATAAAWSLRYTVRRMVWHVMDHVWEIQDRSH